MPEKIILKNRSLNKVKKTVKMAKKGPNTTVFWPWRAEFYENKKKKVLAFSFTFTQDRLLPNFRKCVTDGRTDKRTGLKL